MKILYYSSHPQLNLQAQSGPGTHMREMIHAFQELGHEVMPVIMGGDKLPVSSNTEIKNSSGKQLLKSILPGSIWRTLKENKLIRFDKQAEKTLHEKIVEFKPDVVYERGAYLQTSGLDAVKTQSYLKHVIEINAPYLEEMLLFEGADTLLHNRALEAEKRQVSESTIVSVVSSPLKEYYSQYTTKKDKIIIIPNAINEQLITIDPTLTSAIIARYNLHNKKVIGFVGSIFPYHGVDILIEAFAELKNTYNNLALLIVGDGYIIPDLKKIAARLNIESDVHFTGGVKHSEVYSYINCMDFTVLAKTNYFCSPVKIFEYAALGKTIISIDTPAVRDVLQHKKNAFLIPSSSLSDLADSISHLLQNPDEAERLGRMAKQDILTKHVWIKNAQAVLDHLHKQ